MNRDERIRQIQVRWAYRRELITLGWVDMGSEPMNVFF